MLNSLAHAEQVHQSALESAQHYLEIHPIITTVVGIVFILAVVSLVYMISNNSIVAVVWTLLLIMLILGLFLYSIAPVLSVLAIIIGFLLSLGIVFGGLNKND